MSMATRRNPRRGASNAENLIDGVTGGTGTGKIAGAGTGGGSKALSSKTTTTGATGAAVATRKRTALGELAHDQKNRANQSSGLAGNSKADIDGIGKGKTSLKTTTTTKGATTSRAGAGATKRPLTTKVIEEEKDVDGDAVMMDVDQEGDGDEVEQQQEVKPALGGGGARRQIRPLKATTNNTTGTTGNNATNNGTGTTATTTGGTKTARSAIQVLADPEVVVPPARKVKRTASGATAAGTSKSTTAGAGDAGGAGTSTRGTVASRTGRQALKTRGTTATGSASVRSTASNTTTTTAAAGGAAGGASRRLVANRGTRAARLLREKEEQIRKDQERQEQERLAREMEEEENEKRRKRARMDVPAEVFEIPDSDEEEGGPEDDEGEGNEVAKRAVGGQSRKKGSRTTVGTGRTAASTSDFVTTDGFEDDEGDGDVEFDEEEMAARREEEMVRQFEWDNMDEQDLDDPMMVAEYVKDIYVYLLDLEKQSLPDPDYMNRQDELNWTMRSILMDWLIEVHAKFRLLPETIFLATNIVDRFLSIRAVALVKFQLVGIAALFIACKYEEICCPAVSNFLYAADDGYLDEEVLKAERYVLQMLDYDLSYPNPINYLRRISKGDDYDIQSRTFAKYFIEISCVDRHLIGVPPSLIAAGAVFLARKVLNRGEWNEYLVYLSTYTLEDLLPTAQAMLDYVLRTAKLMAANPNRKKMGTMSTTPQNSFFEPVVHLGDAEHVKFHKKYSAKKYFFAAEEIRRWAEATYLSRSASRRPSSCRLEEWGDEC